MSAVKDKLEGVTKRDVERHIRGWKRRIQALFREIEQWGIEEWGKESIRRGSIEQGVEYMMRKFKVPPRMLPTLEFHVGDQVISFWPSRTWIIGANGRIDVRTGRSHHTLVDRGGDDGQPSDWWISNPSPRVITEPFTRAVFLRIASAKR